MRNIHFFTSFFYILFLFSILSCSSLQKLSDKLSGKNKIVGEGSEDISNLDVSGHKGSDSNKIDGLSTIFFPVDSSSLSSDMKKVLRENKEWFDKNSSISKLELEGHCDPMGSESYNIGLGQKRAESVKSYLISLGVSSDKLSVISYGEEKPLSNSDYSLNRRVNFVPIY